MTLFMQIVKEVMTYQKMYDADSKESDIRRDAYMASKSTDMDTT
jgi:hypothetical protein